MIKREKNKFDEYVNMLIESKSNFRIISNRNNKEIYSDNGIILMKFGNSNLKGFDEKSIKLLMGMYRKVLNNVNQYLENNSHKINKIEPKNIKVKTINRTIFSDIKINDFFWQIDLNSAYWQMAYKLGYINKSLYNQYVSDKSTKLHKQISLAFLNKSIECEYYVSGKMINKIECLCDSNKQVYQNIINQTRNVIADTCEHIDYKIIAQNIDAIYIDKQLLDKAQEYLDKHNILYKKSLCVKVDENKYSNAGEVKNMF